MLSNLVLNLIANRYITSIEAATCNRSPQFQSLCFKLLGGLYFFSTGGVSAMLDKVGDPNPFNIHTNDQDCLVVILEWQLAAKK